MNRRDVLQGMGAAMMVSTANEGKLALAPGMCGASAEEQAAAQPLATRMSEMLIAFARTGDPNCKKVPHWPSYDLKDRNTMIFDSETRDSETRVEKEPRGAAGVLAAGGGDA